MVLPTWQALVLLAWMAAVVIMVVLLIQRVFFVRALLAQSQEACDTLRNLLEQCRRHMGVRGVAGVRLTSLSASPSVCGLLRPMILMPEPMARQLETPQLRSVLFHELAHIQRGDLWINLLQTLLQIVYLYHPLLWLANARIRAIREQAVDEAVLAALGEDAEEYPRTLLSISKLAFGTPSLSLRLLGVVESKRALTARIRQMVSRPFPRSAKLGLASLVMVLVVGAALLPMARANGSASSADVPGPSTAAPVVPAGSTGPDAGTPVAKTELESQPATEKANPPEAGITPRRPFEKQPVKTLNAWVSLKVLEECVVTLDGLKPFSDFWARCRWRVVGLLSEKQTLDYIGGRLADKGSLPIRVYIYYQSETDSAAQRLADAVMSLAREAKADMDTEVHLELTSWTGSGKSTFYLRQGKIRTFYPLPVLRADGGSPLLASGLVDPNDLEQHILWRLTMPKNVPFNFRVEYDDASSKLAKQVADTARAVVKRVGLTELVGVTGALVEPVPETIFLGRWQAVAKGEIERIEVRSAGISLLTIGNETQWVKAGVTLERSWAPTTKEMIVDVGEAVVTKNTCAYQGSIDAEGHLILDRGVVYPQGSFHLSRAPRMVFTKVE